MNKVVFQKKRKVVRRLSIYHFPDSGTKDPLDSFIFFTSPRERDLWVNLGPRKVQSPSARGTFLLRTSFKDVVAAIRD